MNILIINANPSDYHPVYPIGIDYICSELNHKQISYDYLDLQLIPIDEWEVNIRSKLQEIKFDIIGMSIRNLMDDVKNGNWYLPQIKKTIAYIRSKTNKHTLIVIGGSGTSIAPKEVLNFCEADVAISGDGEQAFKELINDYQSNSIIKGKIYYGYIDKISYWNKKYIRGNIGSISEYINNNIAGNVQTKRGCPFHCSYCSYPVIEGNKLRLRNPENVVEEMIQIISLGFKEVFFTDSVFNLPNKYAINILRLMKEQNIKTTWHAFHDPRGITQEYLDLYKKTNNKLPPIQLTVESGSNTMLRSLNKNYKVQDIEKAIKLCDLNGIKYCYSILVGAPGETESTLKETLDFIRKTKPQSVSLFTGVCIHPETTLAYLTKNILWNNKSDLIKPVFYPVDEKLIHEFILEFNRVEMKFLSSNNYYQSTNSYNTNYSNYSNYNNYTSYNSNNYNAIKQKNILS